MIMQMLFLSNLSCCIIELMLSPVLHVPSAFLIPLLPPTQAVCCCTSALFHIEVFPMELIFFRGRQQGQLLCVSEKSELFFEI